MIKKPLMILLLAGACMPVFGARLLVDPTESTVAVDVRANPPHSFTCDLGRYEASIDIDDATSTVSSAEFLFNLTDLDTHNEKRDKKMYGWMDTDTYNVIRWKLNSLEVIEGQPVAHGELFMHGVSFPVDVPFKTVIDGTHCQIEGSADFNYMDFDLPKIRLFIFTVNPELHVHFNLQGTLVAAK